MYSIKHFDRSSGIITFLRHSDNKEISIDCREYNDYRGVSPLHYVEVNSGNIVITELSKRLVMGDPDNLYRAATQSDFDHWHTTQEEYKSTHNAIVFNLIMNA